MFSARIGRDRQEPAPGATAHGKVE